MHNVTIVDGYICQKKQIDLCNAVIKCCSGRTPPLSWQGSGSVFELWPVRLTRVKCNKTNAGRELWGRGPVECLAKCNKTKVRLTLLSQLLPWAVTLLKALFFSVFCPGGLVVASCGFNLSTQRTNHPRTHFVFKPFLFLHWKSLIPNGEVRCVQCKPPRKLDAEEKPLESSVLGPG